MLTTRTLKPGLLVSLKTSVIGNARYQRTAIEPEHLTEDGAQRARWETERVIDDPAERERAIKVRTACRVAICRPCSFSTFGLLCPEDKKSELDAAVRSAQEMAAEFNAKAALTRVHVYVIAGRIAADDVEALRAINSEVRGLLEEMEAGISKLDAQAVRQAAYKAKSIGRMLSPEAEQRLKVAIDAAREVAKKIVKAGEEAGLAIDHAVVKKITESRTMFLDLDEAKVEVKAPKAKGRAVDLTPIEAAIAKAGKKPASPQLELE